ncbi:MAG TPA: hypothetical protein P5317_12870 [Myxococcota bacterium]|jgi:hypothetical protein|nr:hypothetical protein [Myxococcota bacterium]HRV18888.1 hypothetical protein [Myxococcota bacterium]
MYPTKEEIEAVFPGKGQEITDLLTGKVQPTAYVSVIRRVTTSIHFTPYHKRLMIAIAEIVGASPYEWFDVLGYYGFYTLRARVIWSVTDNKLTIVERRD